VTGGVEDVKVVLKDVKSRGSSPRKNQLSHFKQSRPAL
jgi:hypothetical protein